MEMDIPEQITRLLGQVRALSNSYARNKTVSNLENARVWAKELQPENTEAKSNLPTAECICPEGGMRTDCPVHANQP